MAQHRVVITGMGVVSAIGKNVDDFWRSLCEGRHGFGEIELADTSTLQYHHGAEIKDLDVDEPFARSDRPVLDRFARLFVLAAREAVAASGVDSESLTDAGVYTGCAMGGQSTQDELFKQLYGEQRRRITALAVPRIMSSASASQTSMELGIQGPGLNISTACSSSSHAIGLAFWAVARGGLDVAVTGGSEAPFSLGNLKAWDGIRAIAPDLCRPFSAERKGLVLGEGAGVLVLERLDKALERGATIHGEIVGFGMSSDASHITKPSADGASRAIRSALADAEVDPSAVDYVNAHGTGTLLNDATETTALKQVFGDHARELLVSSTKSMHGHALGASGAFECAATTLALGHGTIPPTANYLGPDPDCDLDVVPNDAREKKIELAVSSSFAFGGLNAVLALRRWDGS